VSVVLAAADDRATIVAAIERALASAAVAEVLVIDDASSDGTAESAEAVEDPRVRVVRQPFRLGRGAALRRGMSEATSDIVVVSDADPAHASDDPRLVKPLESGTADAVYVARAGSNGPPGRIVTTVSNALTGLALTDVTTPVKAFRRDAITTLEIDEAGEGFDAALTAELARHGRRIEEVPAIEAHDAASRSASPRRSASVRAVAAAVRHWPHWPRKEVARAGGLTDDVDDELTDTLDNLDDATNYADWIVEQFGDHLRGTVVEIGAGAGTITERLCRTADHVVASDLSPTRVAQLEARFAGSAQVEVVHGDAASVVAGRRVDAVVLVNVLEHIGDDVGVLAELRDALRPGGVVALFVPAHPGLYSDFDRRIGHFRRYTRATLATVLSRAGFDVPMVRYVNAPGALAWWLVARTLNKTPTSGPLVQAYDRRVVPVLRKLESGRNPPFGQSLVALGCRPV
jgi:SAM-dependent methyltransferase